MTDSPHGLASPRESGPYSQTIGLGAFLVAMLIVVALILAAIKLIDAPRMERTSMIPLDQPAAWSGFMA